jgi:hypothetical protein
VHVLAPFNPALVEVPRLFYMGHRLWWRNAGKKEAHHSPKAPAATRHIHVPHGPLRGRRVEVITFTASIAGKGKAPGGEPILHLLQGRICERQLLYPSSLAFRYTTGVFISVAFSVLWY